MTFDPFGDHAERGYLRNVEREKNPEILKRAEHRSFLAGIDTAMETLAGKKTISYPDVLEVHRTLFEAVYPWAGQDRLETAPQLAVTRGSAEFARPADIRRAVEYGLTLGQDAATMRARPGEVMGYLAHGHPFLDGNGRTLVVVHAVLAERAGISIDWHKADKAGYLAALTRELENPGKGELDSFLRPLVSLAIGKDHLASHVRSIEGLAGERAATDRTRGAERPAHRPRSKARDDRSNEDTGRER